MQPSEQTDADLDAGLPEEPIRIEMDKRVDLAIAVAVVVVGAIIVFQATTFRLGRFPDPVTARGLPYLTGGFMIVAGLFLVARRLLTWSAMPGRFAVSEGREDEPDHPSWPVRSYAMIGLALAWVVLLKPLGFLLVTPLMLGGMLLLMEERRWAWIAGFAIGATLFVWVSFALILGITMPLGPLTAPARSLGLVP
jgi:hypothetical protein